MPLVGGDVSQPEAEKSEGQSLSKKLRVSEDVGKSSESAAAEISQVEEAGSSDATEHCVNNNEGQSLPASQAAGEEMEEESDLESVASFGTPARDISLYTLEEINIFLDETYGRVAKVEEYFDDIEKFIRSVAVLKRQHGMDQLDEKKRFRLKKHMTTLRKEAKGKTTRNTRSRSR